MGDFKLDSRGIAAILKGPIMQAFIAAKCAEVAGNVKAQNIKVGDRDGGKSEYPLPVDTQVVTTDRAHGIVALAHPSGLAVEAKHGALGKAAHEAGLEVNK